MRGGQFEARLSVIVTSVGATLEGAAGARNRITGSIGGLADAGAGFAGWSPQMREIDERFR